MSDHRSQPIPIIPSATEIPFLLLPDTASLFTDRAARLKQLAPGHAMADFLRFVAEIVAAQQQVLNTLNLPLPANPAGITPLDFTTLPRDPAWQRILHELVATISPKAPQDYAQWLQHSLEKTVPGTLEQWAEGALHGDAQRCDVGMLPLVSAALQVYWTALTRHLEASAIPGHHADQPHDQCPVCNAPPVGSLLRSGASTQGLRYLSCMLCGSQWHLERIHCIHCGDSAKVAYFNIEGSDGSVQAEVCDACCTYSKIVNMEKSPTADIIADDLASLSLDVLVGEEDYQRYGFNPWLALGAAAEFAN
jgi:FdhE protein